MKGKAQNHGKEIKLYHHGKERFRFCFPSDARAPAGWSWGASGAPGEMGISQGSARSAVILD